MNCSFCSSACALRAWSVKCPYGKTVRDFEPMCSGCGKKPNQLQEYIDAGLQNRCTPDYYVVTDEGTYNRENGHFLCTECYLKAGCPTKPGGQWKAP